MLRLPPSRSISIPRLMSALGLIVIALVLLHIGYSLPPFVRLNDTLVHHIWLDHIPRAQNDLSGTSGQFTARMNRPPSGIIWLENTFQAYVTLTLNNTIVYRGQGSTEIRLDDNLSEALDVQLDYQLPSSIPERARLGLMQRGLLGETYVQPAWDYSPSSVLHDLARTGFWMTLTLALLCVIMALPLTRREAAMMLLLWGLALSVQGVTLAEKLQQSDAHFSMENTWDNYVMMGRSWLVGTTDIVGQYTQVANFVYLGVLHVVLEPDLTTFYGVNAILGSIVPPLLALGSYALFRCWQIGLLTGIFAALFMPLVHYQQTLQPEAVAHIPLALLVCGTAILYRQPRLFWVLMCGGLVGLCTVLRGSWILLILWVVMAILLNNLHWRKKFNLIVLTGLALVVVNLPIVYINFSHGLYMLTPTRSDMQLFRANGLDSLGLASYNGISEQLMVAQKSNYTDALRKDIERDPMRLIELTLRRIGLIWQSEEHSDADQVDYENQSLNISVTTQLLSLNGTLTFRTLLVLSLTGGFLGFLSIRRREALLLLIGAGIWTLTMIPFYSLARFRIGMVVFLLPLAALALWEIWELLQTLRTRPQPERISDPESGMALRRKNVLLQQRLSRFLLIGLGAGLLNGSVLWTADWLTDNMPRPQLVADNEFPSDFVPVGGVFGDQIQLLGYAHYETDYASEGYLTLELFWRAVAPPTEDVFVTLRLIDTDTGEVAHREDVRLGEISAPALPPTQWKVGDTLFEKYLLHLPQVTSPHSYALFVGLFSMKNNVALPLTDATDEILDQHVRVTAVSAHTGLLPLDTKPPLVGWQDSLSLIDVACETAEGLTLDLTWQIEKHLDHDTRVFVHVFSGDTLVTQYDQRLTPPADALPPNAHVTTHVAFPELTSDRVSIQVGLYRFADGQRLPVTYMTDDLMQADSAVVVSGDEPCHGPYQRAIHTN